MSAFAIFNGIPVILFDKLLAKIEIVIKLYQLLTENINPTLLGD